MRQVEDANALFLDSVTTEKWNEWMLESARRIEAEIAKML